MYEPAWQQRWLGDSVPLADGLRGRYGAILLDMAWALFELRMLRDPAADPNQVWAGLTQDSSTSAPTPTSPGGPCGVSWWTSPAT